MTRKEALEELIGKVEAGANGRWTFDALGEDESGLALDAFHGSLDAAKALHEAVLPDWEWGCGFDGDEGFGAGVSRERDEFVVHGGAPSPARAWLLAILRAIHSMEADK